MQERGDQDHESIISALVEEEPHQPPLGIKRKLIINEEDSIYDLLIGLDERNGSSDPTHTRTLLQGSLKEKSTTRALLVAVAGEESEALKTLDLEIKHTKERLIECINREIYSYDLLRYQAVDMHDEALASKHSRTIDALNKLLVSLQD